MVLRLIPQLDGSDFSGGNCGCVATAHALAWATDGKVQVSPHECRMKLKGDWVGKTSVPPSNATSLKDQSRAWAAFKRKVNEERLTLPTFEIKQLEPWRSVIKALEDGHAVMLQIDHATINQKIPHRSGFPTFDGLHVVLLTEIKKVGNRIRILDYDGGFDGRLVGDRRVPMGPQWLPARVLREAAEKKNFRTLVTNGDSEAVAAAKADGTATFAIIGKAELKNVPGQNGGPGPGPGNGNANGQPGKAATVAELKADLAATKEELTQATAAIEKLTDQTAALANALGIIRSLLVDPTEDDPDPAEIAEDIDNLLPPPPPPAVDIEDGVGAET